MRSALVVMLVLARSAAAEPMLEPLPDPCSTDIYLEPSLFLATPPAKLLDRMSLGLVFATCDDARTVTHRIRVGVTTHLSFHKAGAGGELEVDQRIDSTLRLGLRASAETETNGNMWTFGVRMHYSGSTFIELDAFHEEDYDSGGSWGGEVGLGFEGRTGAAVGGVELGVGLIGFIVLAVMLSGVQYHG